MGCIKKYEGYLIIQRHIISLIIRYAKAFLFIVLGLVIFYFSYINLELLKETELNIIAFLLIFLLIHYAFIKIILYTVMHYNNLIIIYDDHFVIVKSSLILKDDIEVIDIYKVMKIDSYNHGLFSNLFGYGSIIIEQQKNDVRQFEYISKPHELLNLFEKQRQEFKTKKYVQV